MLLNLLERLFFQESRACKMLLIDFLSGVLGDSLGEPIEAITHHRRLNYLLDGKQVKWQIEAVTEGGAPLSVCLYVHQSDYFHSQVNSELFDFKQVEPGSSGKVRELLIHVLNFNLLQESDDYHHCYFTSHLQNFNHPDTKAIHYLELPKFTSKAPNTLLEKWLYFFDQISQRDPSDFYRQLVTKEPVFKLAEHLYKRVHVSQNGAIVVKEKQLDLSEWKDLGHQIEKERIALKMIEAGMPYQQIIKLTDMSLAELDALALTIPLLES